MALLQAGPAITVKRETVAVPEWGGDVIVRGLLASEVFAISAIRQQAMRRVVDEMRKAKDAGRDAPEVDMSFDEWARYGGYVSLLLSRTVLAEGDMGLYTQEQWEQVGAQYVPVVERLQAVAERLSGLNAGDVEKNSQSQGPEKS